MEPVTERFGDGDGLTLWQVSAFGRERTAAGRVYHWVNRRRQPTDLVVIQVTLEGSIRYESPQEQRVAGPGSLLLFALGEDSVYGQPKPLERPYRCQWVNLQGAGLMEHINVLRRRHGSVREVGLDHRLVSEHSDLIALADPKRGTSPTAMAAAVHGFILHLFEHAERHRMQRLSPVEQAVEHILQQPHTPLSLEQIAGRFGCSREHLSRAFRERVGRSPGAYLTEAKRARALQLLRETELPLSAVATQSGFHSAATLARQIRRATGQAPSELRSHHD